MRFPLLWIAAAYAAGVFLRGAAPLSLPTALFAAAALALAALLALRKSRARTAWCASLFLWAALGSAAASLQQSSVPPQHAMRLAQSAAFDSRDTLRWRGALRSDPLLMPWGMRFEVALDEVEIAAQPRPVSGGLRVNYFRNAQQPAEPQPLVRAGDRVEVLVRARPPRNFQNPGAFDARTQLARQGIHLTGTLRSLELLRRVDSPPLTLGARAARARGFFLNQIETLFRHRPEHAAVLRAILLGDYSFVDHDVAETFQKTAAYHVLVISGLHVAALAAFVFWVGRKLRFPLLTNSWLTLLVLAAFVAIVEDRPPIERAALMTVLVLAAGLLFRRVELLNTVGAAVLIMLALNPAAISDPSFQLSFLAGAMIGALGLPLVDRSSAPYRDALAHLSDVTRDSGHTPRVTQFRLDLRSLAEWFAARLPLRFTNHAFRSVRLPFLAAFTLWDVFVISCAIQIAMLPVLAHYFHRVSVAGPIANIPAALLSALLIPFGLGALLLGAIFQPLAAVPAMVTSWLTGALLSSVAWFGEWPGGSYRIPGPPVWLAIVFFVAVAALAWVLHDGAFRGRRAIALASCIALIAASLGVALYPFAPMVNSGHLEATMLDVGQGDSIFISFPQGQTMLVDGGGQFGSSVAGGVRSAPDIGEQVVSPFLWSRGLKRIDVVALSHAHQDHLEGLRAVLENFVVGELWIGRSLRSPGFAALLRLAAERGVRVRHRQRGDTFSIGGASGIVLWPEDNSLSDTAANNDSVVLRLQFGQRSFLLAGDVEAAVERELFLRGDPLDADFLKVPHHASRTSTTTDFALAVRPEVAVMSLSENNPFGHPHPQVLATLQAMQARSFRTDRDGAVTVSTDGTSLNVRAHAAQRTSAEPARRAQR